MKKTTCLALFLFLLTCQYAGAQGFLQIGTPLVPDQGFRMIVTSDGGYITAGTAGDKAVLYKTDCLGTLVASIEKAYNPGPAAFWDVTELADGSIAAVGGAQIGTLVDTGGSVIMLKTNPNLVETASTNFRILGKEAQGKAIAQATSGELLLWGEVTGVSVDFTDAFFQRVNPLTLQASTDPVIFNNGVDLASRILKTKDGNYLLSGSSFAGNIFNPDAPIDNKLWAYKVNEFGTLLWQTNVQQTFLAKYGVGLSCGAAQNTDSENFMLAGTLFGGTDLRAQDAFFALIGNDGALLDTVYAAADGQQKFYGIIAHHDLVGLVTIAGESDGSPFGVPSVAVAQAYELNNAIVANGATLDPSSPVSVRDLLEVDPGRVAYMGTIPDNPTVLTSTDIIVITPEAVVGVVYQNCALAATFSTTAVAFQWYYEGQPIANANQGVHFPAQPGLYQVGVIDSKGCYGISDTFRVKGPVADFSVAANGLTITITNNSQNAVSYLWNFCDGNTSTETNPVHTYGVPGVYCLALITTDQCGLKDTLIQQVGVTPTDEPSWLNHFSLSPNPTSDIFNLEMSGTAQGSVEFTLFNAVGQLLQQEETGFQSGFLQKSFDLGLYPTGVYSLQIRSGREAKNVLVVKR